MRWGLSGQEVTVHCPRRPAGPWHPSRPLPQPAPGAVPPRSRGAARAHATRAPLWPRRPHRVLLSCSSPGGLSDTRIPSAALVSSSCPGGGLFRQHRQLVTGCTAAATAPRSPGSWAAGWAVTGPFWPDPGALTRQLALTCIMHSPHRWTTGEGSFPQGKRGPAT